MGVTKREAMDYFESRIAPAIIRNQGYERVAMRMAWNDYVDHIVKNGYVSEARADTWRNPYDMSGHSLERSIKARQRYVEKLKSSGKYLPWQGKRWR